MSSDQSKQYQHFQIRKIIHKTTVNFTKVTVAKKLT